jgi:hypothetical protein
MFDFFCFGQPENDLAIAAHEYCCYLLAGINLTTKTAMIVRHRKYMPRKDKVLVCG